MNSRQGIGTTTSIFSVTNGVLLKPLPMSSLLYGVEATDPVTFSAVAVMLMAIALVASYVPAVRASRTNPLVALRFE